MRYIINLLLNLRGLFKSPLNLLLFLKPEICDVLIWTENLKNTCYTHENLTKKITGNNKSNCPRRIKEEDISRGYYMFSNMTKHKTEDYKISAVKYYLNNDKGNGYKKTSEEI